MEKINRKRTTAMNFHSVGNMSHIPYVEKFKEMAKRENLTYLNTDAKREICWDFYPVETHDGITLKTHKPVKRNVAFRTDRRWEGGHTLYMSCLKAEDTYKIFYHACGTYEGEAKTMNDYDFNVCVAESKNGKTFTKPRLTDFTHFGFKENNIVFASDRPSLIIDNFVVYYDENPDCPPDAKYKAIAGDSELGNTLAYYKSATGYNFEFVRCLDIPGNFDSMNTLMWDKDENVYRIFFRGAHECDTADENGDSRWNRDVRMTYSKDMFEWSDPELLQFDDGRDEPLYTNGIQKYYRGNIFYGIPTRYCNRMRDIENFVHLPLLKTERERIILNSPDAEIIRGATAITDCYTMCSRDGVNFTRSQEAFLTPGIENDNWVYGNCYFGWGLLETESDFDGNPNEISLYIFEGHRSREHLECVRYTLRLDGFFSWSAPLTGGVIVTKPTDVTAVQMEINFETSAIGYVKITLLDENNIPIEGYESGKLFGNSVSRPVDFEKDIRDLKGKKVKIKFECKDCEIYSYII